MSKDFGMSLLQRYLDGDTCAVWDDLHRAGSSAARPDAVVDALAVARETMTRVRRNIERVVADLEKRGYEFGGVARHTGRPGPPLSAPVSEATLDHYEQAVGPLPLSLRAFWVIVGGTDLVGTPERTMPLWPTDPTQLATAAAKLLELADASWPDEGELDPLQVFAPGPLVDGEIELFLDPVMKYCAGVGAVHVRVSPGAVVLRFQGAAMSAEDGSRFSS